MRILLSLFAGVGLIFIGAQFLTAGVKQAAGARVRAVLAKAAKQRWRLVTSGIGAGALIQSPNAISFMAVSLVGAGALTVESGSLIVAWAYVGSTVRVLAAAIDLYAAVLFALGVVGLGYYLEWEKDPAKQHWLKALLGLALLMLGINLIVSGTQPLKSVGWVREALVIAGKYYPIGFVIGTALAVVVRGNTVTMIVMGLARGGLLDMDQAAIVVAGAVLGAGIVSYGQAANLHGEERQLSIMQLILKIVAVVIIVPLLLVEHFFGVPTISALSDYVSSDIAFRLVFLWFLSGVVPAVVLLPVNAPLCRLLARLSPPTAQQSLGRPQFIFPQAAEDPASALDLSRLEQSRAFQSVPVMLEPICEGGRKDVKPDEIKAGATQLLTAIDRFLASALKASPNNPLAEAMMTSQHLNQVIKELVETNAEFVALVSKARADGKDSELFSRLAEPLHAMLTIAADRMGSGAARDVEDLITLGKARDQLLADLRKAVLDQPESFNRAQREAFYRGTRLFERIIWLVGRIGASLASVHEGMADAQPAGGESPEPVASR